MLDKTHKSVPMARACQARSKSKNSVSEVAVILTMAVMEMGEFLGRVDIQRFSLPRLAGGGLGRGRGKLPRPYYG